MSVILVKNLGYHLVPLQITELDLMIKELVDSPHVFVAFLMDFSVKDIIFGIHYILFKIVGFVVGMLIFYKENKCLKCFLCCYLPLIPIYCFFSSGKSSVL